MSRLVRLMPPKMPSSSSQKRRLNWSPILPAGAQPIAAIACFVAAGHVEIDLAQQRQRQRRDGEVGLELARPAVHLVADAHAVLRLHQRR